MSISIKLSEWIEYSKIYFNKVSRKGKIKSDPLPYGDQCTAYKQIIFEYKGKIRISYILRTRDRCYYSSKHPRHLSKNDYYSLSVEFSCDDMMYIIYILCNSRSYNVYFKPMLSYIINEVVNKDIIHNMLNSAYESLIEISKYISVQWFIMCNLQIKLPNDLSYMIKRKIAIENTAEFIITQRK